MSLYAARSILAIPKTETSWDWIVDHDKGFLWTDDDTVERWNQRAARKKLSRVKRRVEGSFAHERMFLTYKEKTVEVPLTHTRDDKLIILHTLARLVRQDSDIRFCVDGWGSDDLGFLALPPRDWKKLEKEFGADAVAHRFLAFPEDLEEFNQRAFSEENRSRYRSEETETSPEEEQADSGGWTWEEAEAQFREALEAAVRDGTVDEPSTGMGMTLLMEMCQQGIYGLIEECLDHGGRPTTRDEDGNTALTHFVRRTGRDQARSPLHDRIFQRLLQSVDLGHRADYGWTVFLEACAWQSPYIEDLVAAGASIDDCLERGAGALVCAIAGVGNIDHDPEIYARTYQRLVALGCDPLSKLPDGRSISKWIMDQHEHGWNGDEVCIQPDHYKTMAHIAAAAESKAKKLRGG